ncbi:MAG: methylenetetrahydrofolate reductase [Xanthobacteraceae bacterium]
MRKGRAPMINLAAATIGSGTDPPGTDHVADFLRQASFETTRLTAADRDAAGMLAGGTSVYISAIPGRSREEQVTIAAELRACGVEPVPHIAVREFPGADAVELHLSRLAAQAGVRRLLIVGGDRAEPAGPFHGAVELIESGLLQACGIEEIGVAGYPDGHPRITAEELDRALAAKLEGAVQTGLRLHIVTQFAFAAEPILRWIERLRDLGIDHPVRVGLAGPATLSSLLRFAQICGVKTSAQALTRTGLVKTMFGLTAPDRVIRPLAEACAGEGLGEVTPHLYSFGGLAGAIRWAMAGAAGQIDFDQAGGFTVVAP